MFCLSTWANRLICCARMMRCQMMSRQPFRPSSTRQPRRKAVLTTASFARTAASTLGGSAGVPTATGAVVSCAPGAAPTTTSSGAILGAKLARGKRFACAARRCSRITSGALDCHSNAHVVERRRAHPHPPHPVLWRASMRLLCRRREPLLRSARNCNGGGVRELRGGRVSLSMHVCG